MEQEGKKVLISVLVVLLVVLLLFIGWQIYLNFFKDSNGNSNGNSNESMERAAFEKQLKELDALRSQSNSRLLNTEDKTQQEQQRLNSLDRASQTSPRSVADQLSELNRLMAD